MQCQQCKVDINPVGGTFAGVTKLRVPVLQGRCKNGHVYSFQLQAIKNMELPRGDKFPAAPGCWQGGKIENVNITCPICRGNFGLGVGKGPHTIDDVGVVSPSMVCPYGCGWHTHIKLKEFEGL